MSDTGRKDFTTQAKETFTPESQKTPLDKAGETLTDAGDKVAATLQPGDSKSTTQKLSDTASSGTKDAQDGGKGIVQQVQETAQATINTISEGTTNLINSISGSGTSGTSGTTAK